MILNYFDIQGDLANFLGNLCRVYMVPTRITYYSHSVNVEAELEWVWEKGACHYLVISNTNVQFFYSDNIKKRQWDPKTKEEWSHRMRHNNRVHGSPLRASIHWEALKDILGQL